MLASLQCSSRFSRIFILLFSTLFIVTTVFATIETLSGNMNDDRDVLDFKLSSDGLYAIFRSDRVTDDADELYRVPLIVPGGGSQPQQLSGILPSGSEVTDYEISPDGNWVVYMAPQDNVDVVDLYSVPLTGTSAAGLKLNHSLSLTGNVLDFAISDDSQTVVYRAHDDSDLVNELYAVPMTGGTAVKLNGTLVDSGDVIEYAIGPAGEDRVVFLADKNENNTNELFTVPISGGIATQINGPLANDGDVQSFQVSTASGMVVYRANQQNNQVIELYSVPIGADNTQVVKLNPTMSLGGNVVDFDISNDGETVIYRADAQVEDRFELFSVPIDGPDTETVKLNGALSPSVGRVLNYKISSDDAYVVYRAIQQTPGSIELYSVPLRGPAAAGAKLNDDLVENGDVTDFQISPNNSLVVYLADQNILSNFELFVVDITGPGNLAEQLHLPLGSNRDVNDFLISPDSLWVLYRADAASDDLWELFRASLTVPSTPNVRINMPLVGDQDVAEFGFAPDSGRIVYIADQVLDEKDELFIADDNLTTVGFVSTSLVVTESVGVVELPIQLSTSAVMTVTMDIDQTAGTAVSNTHYLLPVSPIQVSPGKYTATIEVPIIDNDITDPDRDVVFTLSNANGASITESTFYLTILNDDFYAYFPAIKHEYANTP
ncbi:MAG: hypothetical protein DWQ04_06445 [Chloroflexi bacterium]|nr:MAG: hypothetical protein DWQ04_06445 [Chloroflexota bacterium]